VKHRLFMVATATFVAGVIVGHYAMPRSARLPAPTVSATNETSIRSSEGSSPTLSISTPNQFDPAASLSENVIVAIENAAAHPGNRQIYSEVNNLIETLDPKDVRPLIDAIQHLLNPHERNTFMSMLITRWAEGDLRGALDYVQIENAALGLPTDSGRDQAITDIAQQWAEKDPTAAEAYAAALPPGETKDLMITAIARQLTSSHPQTALN